MLRVEKINNLRIITEDDSGHLNNVILIEDLDSIIIVDTFMKSKVMNEMIESVIKPIGKPVKAIIFTHWHIDHTIGACLLGKADIIATEECYKQLSDFQLNHQERLIHKGVIEKNMYMTLPNKIITEKHILQCKNGNEIIILPLPGHSFDSLIVIYNDTMIVGDTLVGKEIEVFVPPVIPPDAKKSKVEDLLKAIQFIKESKQERIITGHGQRMDKHPLIEMNILKINEIIQK